MAAPRVGADIHRAVPVRRRIPYSSIDDAAFGHVFTVEPAGAGTTQITVGPGTDRVSDCRPLKFVSSRMGPVGRPSLS
ncbi:hypothetical protein GCM10009557_20870 [Virgisporangium ochraceum]|uniref:Uncharacterized protein n=1 Tax=Virgisporangium ochraceum TaxID=65505 RepID=A0A8J4EE73_9ACTN|nr:hypothetical protein Voc01_062400 [Virgisporangium ochraceum]